MDLMYFRKKKGENNMNYTEKIPKNQSFRLLNMGLKNDKDIVFTLTGEGESESETALMIKSVRAIFEALNEDINNDYLARQKIAKELLVNIADFVAGDNPGQTNGFYKSRLIQKVILGELISSL